MTTFCGKNIRKFNDDDELHGVGRAAATAKIIYHFLPSSLKRQLAAHVQWSSDYRIIIIIKSIIMTCTTELPNNIEEYVMTHAAAVYHGRRETSPFIGYVKRKNCLKNVLYYHYKQFHNHVCALHIVFRFGKFYRDPTASATSCVRGENNAWRHAHNSCACMTLYALAYYTPSWNRKRAYNGSYVIYIYG